VNHFCAAKTAFDVPRWGPNVAEFVKRFDPRYTAGEGPKRLKNMYFTYLVEMRALVKAAPYLLQVQHLHTGVVVTGVVVTSIVVTGVVVASVVVTGVVVAAGVV